MHCQILRHVLFYNQQLVKGEIKNNTNQLTQKIFQQQISLDCIIINYQERKERGRKKERKRKRKKERKEGRDGERERKEGRKEGRKKQGKKEEKKIVIKIKNKRN